MGFSRQEHWSVLLFPSPEDHPNPRIEPQSPAWQADSVMGNNSLTNPILKISSGLKNEIICYLYLSQEFILEQRWMKHKSYNQIFTSFVFKAELSFKCTNNQSVQFKVTLYVHSFQEKSPFSLPDG